jgi:dimethylargininase
MPLVAITREVSAGLANCELTHLARVPIDVDRARVQHRAYVDALGAAGCRVAHLPAAADMPDSVFVEDIAVAFDELAIVMRPGAESRRGEIDAVSTALAAYRPLHAIEPPATIDGGDVLVVGRRVFVGRSSRTNADAVAQMRRILGPHGYTVCELTVHGCLHLKSAVTGVADDLLLVNPEWIEKTAFAGFRFVDVDPSERPAANALRIGDDIIFPAAFPRTADRLARHGLHLRIVDASELAKAEGAVTCCSIVLQDGV